MKASTAAQGVEPVDQRRAACHVDEPVGEGAKRTVASAMRLHRSVAKTGNIARSRFADEPSGPDDDLRLAPRGRRGLRVSAPSPPCAPPRRRPSPPPADAPHAGQGGDRIGSQRFMPRSAIANCGFATLYEGHGPPAHCPLRPSPTGSSTSQRPTPDQLAQRPARRGRFICVSTTPTLTSRREYATRSRHSAGSESLPTEMPAIGTDGALERRPRG